MCDANILAFMLLISVPPTSNDLAFEFAQEAFVSRAVPGHKPPAKIQAVIEQLGDDEYHCREVASRQLRKLDSRWIMWGLWSPDIEVRLRATTTLKLKSRCNECGGNGLCPFSAGKDSQGYSLCKHCGRSGWYHINNDGGDREMPMCPFCLGHGTTWNRGLFDIPPR